MLRPQERSACSPATALSGPEIGSPGEFEAMQDDELERVLIERLGALGLSLSPIAEDGETQH